VARIDCPLDHALYVLYLISISWPALPSSFCSYCHHPLRDLHSFPTRRSSDLLAAIAYPTTKIRVNATCRKCPHKVHRMEMKTAISCTILRHTKILIAVGV